MLPRLAQLRDGAIQAGRAPVPTTLFVGPTDPVLLERYAEAGVHRVVYPLPAVTALGEIERELDRLANALGEQLPASTPAFP